MTTVDEMNKEIKLMGYVPFIPKSENPNYYRLDEGTILRVYPILNNLTLNPAQADSLQVNVQNIIATFVPKKLRGIPSAKSYTQQELQANIEVFDMPFTTLTEDFNVYEVDSKQILSIKTTVSQISKSKLFSNNGEPIYLVATAIVAKSKPKGIM
jgi:hypothetical protein